MKVKGEVIEYDRYEGEYINIQSGDDDRFASYREALMALPLAERKIFIMYTEIGTYSGVAKILKCSVPTVSKKVNQIRVKLLNIINGNN